MFLDNPKYISLLKVKAPSDYLPQNKTEDFTAVSLAVTLHFDHARITRVRTDKTNELLESAHHVISTDTVLSKVFTAGVGSFSSLNFKFALNTFLLLAFSFIKCVCPADKLHTAGGISISRRRGANRPGNLQLNVILLNPI